MGYIASLVNLDLGNILLHCRNVRLSGTLTIEKGDDVADVHFFEGFIFQANSNNSRERIGQVLVRGRVVTQSKLRQALKEANATKSLLGETLVSMGFISKPQLKQGLHSQVMEILHKRFHSESGYIYFEEYDEEKESFLDPIDTYEVILTGSRKLRSWNRFYRKIPYKDSVMEKTDDWENHPFISYLTKEEKQVLNLVDGNKTVAEICNSSPLDEFPTCKLLYNLYYIQVIQKSLQVENARNLKFDEVIPVFEEVFTCIYHEVEELIPNQVNEFIGENILEALRDQPLLLSCINNTSIGWFQTPILMKELKSVPEDSRLEVLVTGLSSFLFSILNEFKNGFGASKLETLLNRLDFLLNSAFIDISHVKSKLVPEIENTLTIAKQVPDAYEQGLERLNANDIQSAIRYFSCIPSWNPKYSETIDKIKELRQTLATTGKEKETIEIETGEIETVKISDEPVVSEKTEFPEVDDSPSLDLEKIEPVQEKETEESSLSPVSPGILKSLSEMSTEITSEPVDEKEDPEPLKDTLDELDKSYLSMQESGSSFQKSELSSWEKKFMDKAITADLPVINGEDKTQLEQDTTEENIAITEPSTTEAITVPEDSTGMDGEKDETEQQETMDTSEPVFEIDEKDKLETSDTTPISQTQVPQTSHQETFVTDDKIDDSTKTVSEQTPPPETGIQPPVKEIEKEFPEVVFDVSEEEIEETLETLFEKIDELVTETNNLNMDQIQEDPFQVEPMGPKTDISEPEPASATDAVDSDNVEHVADTPETSIPEVTDEPQTPLDEPMESVPETQESEPTDILETDETPTVETDAEAPVFEVEITTEIEEPHGTSEKTKDLSSDLPSLETVDSAETTTEYSPSDSDSSAGTVDVIEEKQESLDKTEEIVFDVEGKEDLPPDEIPQKEEQLREKVEESTPSESGMEKQDPFLAQEEKIDTNIPTTSEHVEDAEKHPSIEESSVPVPGDETLEETLGPEAVEDNLAVQSGTDNAMEHEMEEPVAEPDEQFEEERSTGEDNQPVEEPVSSDTSTVTQDQIPAETHESPPTMDKSGEIEPESEQVSEQETEMEDILVEGVIVDEEDVATVLSSESPTIAESNAPPEQEEPSDTANIKIFTTSEYSDKSSEPLQETKEEPSFTGPRTEDKDEFVVVEEEKTPVEPPQEPPEDLEKITLQEPGSIDTSESKDISVEEKAIQLPDQGDDIEEPTPPVPVKQDQVPQEEGPGLTEKVEQYHKIGNVFYDKGHYTEALEFFNKALMLLPDHSPCLEKRDEISNILNSEDFKKPHPLGNIPKMNMKKFKEIGSKDFTDKEMLLISQIDGRLTLKELCYLSSLPEKDSLSLFIKLSQRGVLHFE